MDFGKFASWQPFLFGLNIPCSLCKNDDVKNFYYHKIFELLAQDLVTLEQQGVLVSQLDIFAKGTLPCVVSDNTWNSQLCGKFLRPIFL